MAKQRKAPKPTRIDLVEPKTPRRGEFGETPEVNVKPRDPDGTRGETPVVPVRPKPKK
jgi:hypothetical protein